MTYTRNITDRELRALARIAFEDEKVLGTGWYRPAPTPERQYSPQLQGTVRGSFKHWNDEDFATESILRESLEGFGLVYDAGTYSASHVLRLTEAGREALADNRPRWYGCRCEHAVRTGCVCSESTYCPNPEHTGNGCHGTHD